MNATPSERYLDGSADYLAAFDELLGRATHELRLFDRRLERGFDGSARCTRLRAFLRGSPRNRLRIVLHDTSALARDCPRLLDLQRQFSHAVAIHETEAEARAVHDPFAIADLRDHLHRFHHDQPRAVLRLDDPAGTRTFMERFEEIWSFSAPAVNATILGL